MQNAAPIKDKPQLLGFSLPELEDWLVRRGAEPFRAGQVFSWLHRGQPFDGMSNLPLALRRTLAQEAVDQPVRLLSRQESRRDGTRKLLFGLGDGHCVEGVLMRYRHGLTLCLSTQAGCRMGCAFCASTLEGLARNLTAAEMLGQVLCADRLADGGRIGNLVLMGSGEPLDNYDETLRFLKLVSHPGGRGIGLRHISLSTCGLTDRILRFSGEGLPVTLSVSLHAPNDAIRTQIMPVARAWPLEGLLRACREYIEKTGRRVVFEYTLLQGVNSAPGHAEELARRLRGMQCHVNLIPYNPVPERPFRAADSAAAADFLRVLRSRGISATVRRRLGEDVTGACGQLRRSRMRAGEGTSGLRGPAEGGDGP